jgi:hypothetical protein
MLVLLSFLVCSALLHAETPTVFTFSVSGNSEGVQGGTSHEICQSENGYKAKEVIYEPGPDGNWHVTCIGSGIIFCDFDCRNEPVNNKFIYSGNR